MLVPNIFGDKLFDDLFYDFTRPEKNTARNNAPATNVMRTDIKEFDGGYELDVELPGYKKEDVQAELKDGYLTITATSNNNREEQAENGKYIYRERYSGSCSRAFFVGEDMTQQDIRAKFEDGILKLYVPKKEAKPPVEEKRFITIEG